MLDKPYTLVDYCMYKDGYIKKPTIFFNNFNLSLKRCDKNHKHLHYNKFSRNIYNRYIIPSLLVEELRKSVNQP